MTLARSVSMEYWGQKQEPSEFFKRWRVFNVYELKEKNRQM